MQLSRISYRSLVAVIFSIFALTATSFAQEFQHQDFSNIRIKNFGQMDERFYRGAEPKKLEDFQALKSLGINTVIDLQAKPEATEKGMVESLGMQYINIPMVEKTYPKPEWVAAFMKTVDEPTTGKFFVHCAGGRHRTGAMGAVYRYEKYGWDYDQVYKEMKQFDFYTSWGHGGFKKFVQDYWQQAQTQRAAAASAHTPHGHTATVTTQQ